MKKMLEVLHHLKLPPWLIDCALGKTEPPPFTFDMPTYYGYGFPPSVLPIWSSEDGPDYIALLHHPFRNRQTTFITFHIPSGSFTEFARTSDQLKVRVLYDLFCNAPEIEAVEEFAEKVGLCDREKLETYFEPYHTEEELAQHPSFIGCLPLELIESNRENYSGDFLEYESEIEKFCCFEVPEEKLMQQKNLLPTWFSTESQPQVFDEFLWKGDFTSAWFSLNSTGWKSSDMKIALQRLTDKSKNDYLQILNSWIQTEIPSESRY
ncbi:Hypothetical protein PBC10988_9570 [Planctomycetales bacterium 10988]|nr:Hypothetical protein PBC10988_9570 [Planctomycetales bacterium 10988]